MKMAGPRRAGYKGRGMTFNNMAIMLPWLTKLTDEDRSLLGEDWWPYGGQSQGGRGRPARYHHEQGLTKQRLTCEDIFVPYLLPTDGQRALSYAIRPFCPTSADGL
jgi:hypothetical protein